MKDIVKSDRIIIVISNKVYDVTSYLGDHPGGEEILIQNSGKDATYEFNDVGHSMSAIHDMLKYEIGEISRTSDDYLVEPLVNEKDYSWFIIALFGVMISVAYFGFIFE
tara:strand:- start:1509 stop:1835 length:327 start_codon:yes stop_codon:yes gene_type:complete